MARIRYLTDGEVKGFFKVISRADQRLFFKLALKFGLRVREATGLRIEDFQPSVDDPQELKITRAKNGIGRTYELDPETKSLLKAWLRQRRPDSPWLFPGRDPSKHLTIIGAQMNHRRIALRAGVDHEKVGNIHAWRHTCAVWLLSAGEDPYFVRTWLGHRTIRSTEAYLTYTQPAWTRRARQAMAVLS